uniref:Plexin B3 n=1 Tax=Cyprinodon variegatus TaxID=28743 RepID=A0A3Q2C8B1_CYPVA
MLASSISSSVLLLLLLLLPPSHSADDSIQRVQLDGSPLSHLLLDPGAGRLYVGGVDHLYQLTPDLEVVSEVRTGPELDSPDCLPPINHHDCSSATPTHNHNKLLLMERGQGAEPGSLIVCGSLFQGICEKRSLSNVSQLIYRTSNPVDTQYVAANDPRVSTVGVVITVQNKQEGAAAGGELHLMLVGRGYTSRGPGDIPPITTRRLHPVTPPRRAFSQEEELGKLVVGSYSEYSNHFVKAIVHGDHVYFLFSRRDMRHKKEYRTYASRLCTSDRSFYSYVEVPLLCREGYNLAQGAWLGNVSGRPALFVAMAAGQASTPVATSRSALCIYGMTELDAMMRRAQEVCYTKEGRDDGGHEVAYIEYYVSSKCLKLPKDSLSEYPCGGEHTPNPIASAVPLGVPPTVTLETQLTSVTTATEAGLTIAFLGDREGRLHKVLVRSDWSGELYGSLLVDEGGAIGADLLLDESQQHLYVLTEERVRHAARQTDCQSCLSIRDPYCGWCVLEGRCSRKHECERHLLANHWLWSFEQTNQCVTVQSLQPANQSREDANTRHILRFFLNMAASGETERRRRNQHSCELSEWSLQFCTDNKIYRCLAIQFLLKCLACVSSSWSCNWCPLDQLCTHTYSCPSKNLIQNQKDAPGPSSCPLVFSLRTSALVPMGFNTTIVLEGRNLDVFMVRLFLNKTIRLQFQTSNRPSGSSMLTIPPSVPSVHLYDCSAGQSDCSQCKAVPKEYGCVWCPGSPAPSCVYSQSCSSSPSDTCPSPQITQVFPVSGPLEGGILVTITGSNLGTRYQDVLGGVKVADVPCLAQPEGYRISTRVVCELQRSGKNRVGPVQVTVGTTSPGRSAQMFTYQDPQLTSLVPDKGPVSGGTKLTIKGRQLMTGQKSDLTAFLGQQPCYILNEVTDSHFVCKTGSSNQTGAVPVQVFFGKADRTGPDLTFRYLDDPVITKATPPCFLIRAISVWVEPLEVQRVKRRRRFALLTAKQQLVFNGTMATRCSVLSSSEITCRTPAVSPELRVKGVWFQLDNVRVHFNSIEGKTFRYLPNPQLFPLNREAPDAPYRFKPGGVIAVEGQDLTKAMTKDEVQARLGEQGCEVKTLDRTHLYCEPPETQPLSVDGSNELPSLKVFMGNLKVDLGLVQYDSDSLLSPIPLAAQIGLGAGAAVIILSVLVVILMYRRKSKQALRDYKKVLLQLETLEINVGDQCRKEFTDLMTEMMDLSSDVGGPGLPLLDYKTYADRIFFPGQQTALLSHQLDLPESRRQTVEQGLQQLNNLLNNRLFLTRFIHTLEAQQGFSQRDRGYVASLLTIALHDKLEYFTEVMKTLLQDLVQQYVAKNPKLMLRRTETVVEKMLTNWMSICLYSFLKEVAGEPLYMLYRAIKYQVDKGPVDAVTGKAKRTLNDSHLLREDIDYSAMLFFTPWSYSHLSMNVWVQVKDKILDQVYRGAPFSQRPAADSLDLEWRSGQAGHLTLSDDDVTAVVHGRWKRLNTLQHYKVPDGATVALIPRFHSSGINQVFQTGEKAPMLEGEEEEGLRLWHLVKSSEDPEMPKHRKSSMRERERAKAIPEIYLTRLLSMKGTLQKFVDDVFVAILSTKRPPPIAVRFFFDFLDDMAEKHAIDDPETVHIWKTNSLPLRFWVNILKNPQFVLDVQVTDSIDAVLSVIAQTFIDSCTTSEHKVGRVGPVSLYTSPTGCSVCVCRYYSDIHSAASGCYQEMNSTLTELSGSFASEMNSLVALHELYKYINKYYDQIIMSLEEDTSGQKMQLAYRLQQVAALVENKVTDL